MNKYYLRKGNLLAFLYRLNRAAYMLYLIERAKKCLDFSATLYIVHLFICIIYGGWPSSFTWWIVNLTCLALMALLGEWLCIRRELREIPITRLRSSKPSYFTWYQLFMLSSSLKYSYLRTISCLPVLLFAFSFCWNTWDFLNALLVLLYLSFAFYRLQFGGM